jgi:alpha/beta superfamily hydrolase
MHVHGQAVARAPVVVMGHGIGGQKDMALHGFADRFASAGIAAVIFDYRTFGGSDGEPRHWVSPKRHLEDWDAAIKHVQARPPQGQWRHRRRLLALHTGYATMSVAPRLVCGAAGAAAAVPRHASDIPLCFPQHGFACGVTGLAACECEDSAA